MYNKKLLKLPNIKEKINNKEKNEKKYNR